MSVSMEAATATQSDLNLQLAALGSFIWSGRAAENISLA